MTRSRDLISNTNYTTNLISIHENQTPTKKFAELGKYNEAPQIAHCI